MKALYIVMMTVAVIALTASAQSAANTRVDSGTATQQQQTTARSPQQTSQPSLNKQASVNRPTKSTNWSKIKTLFE